MLEGLLLAGLGLIGIAAAALAVPVDIAARLELGLGTRCSVRVDLLFGLVRLQRDLGARSPDAPEKPAKKKRKRGSRRPGSAVVRRGFRLLGDLLDRVHIRHAHLDLTVGTDDPAQTGELAGFAAPIVVLANALPRTRVTLRPDFTGPAFEAAGEGKVRFVPMKLVPPIVGFAASPEVRRWLSGRR
jgi:hypothetical protein